MSLKPFTPQTDMKLEWEAPFYKRLPPDVDIMEGGNEYLILAKCGDEDLMLWMGSYIFLGRTDAAGYLPDEGMTVHAMLFTVPSKDRGTMQNNDFMCVGWNPSTYYPIGDLKVEKTDSNVDWVIRDMRFGNAPPYWTVKGTDKGITYDLKMTGRFPTSFWMGEYGNVDADIGGKRGFQCSQGVVCNGTIAFQGKTYEIVNAYGEHNHPVIQKFPWKNAEETGPKIIGVAKGEPAPYTTWISGGGEDLSFFIYSLRANNLTYGSVGIDGQMIVFKGSESVTEVREWWKDPRTGTMIPSAWHVQLHSEKGTFILDATASGRANRICVGRSSIALEPWTLASASGYFQYPDGRKVEFKDYLMGAEWIKQIWP